MRLSCIYESVVEFVKLSNILGTGASNTLNYGTQEGSDRLPMLYVPFSLSVVNSLRKHLSRYKIWVDDDGLGHIEPGGFTDIMHVGEAHCTIASTSPTDDLAGALNRIKKKYNVDSDEEALKTVGLFSNDGVGANFPLIPKRSDESAFFVGYARFYADEIDPQGPIIVGLRVDAPNWGSVRRTLGLRKYPKLKQGTYIPHVTIGYVNPSKTSIRRQISRSYMKQLEKA